MSIPHRCTRFDRPPPARAIFACVVIALASVGPAHGLTLTEAIVAAIAANPELTALEHEKRALDAAVGQARLLPNPELQTEVENVGGTGSRENDEAAESTLRLAQRVELGGKRDARTRVAASAVDVAAAEIELRRREVTAAVKVAFAEALAAKSRALLAADLEQLAAEAARSVRSAIDAGATSSAEADRARLVETKARSERILRDRQATAARAAIAATWGESNVTFGELVGALDMAIVVPTRAALASLALDDHPAIVRAEALVAERSAAVSLERANRVPDITVAAGGRHFNDDDDVAAVFALSAPLPLFDRNQSALAEAEARVAQAREQRRSAELALRTSLLAAYDRYVSADEQRALIDESVLPVAERAVATSSAAHRSGRLPYDEVVDARRTLYEVRLDRIDQLEERLVAAIELEHISGLRPFDVSKGDSR